MTNRMNLLLLTAIVSSISSVGNSATLSCAFNSEKPQTIQIAPAGESSPTTTKLEMTRDGHVCTASASASPGTKKIVLGLTMQLPDGSKIHSLGVNSKRAYLDHEISVDHDFINAISFECSIQN